MKLSALFENEELWSLMATNERERLTKWLKSMFKRDPRSAIQNAGKLGFAKLATQFEEELATQTVEPEPAATPEPEPEFEIIPKRDEWYDTIRGAFTKMLHAEYVGGNYSEDFEFQLAGKPKFFHDDFIIDYTTIRGQFIMVPIFHDGNRSHESRILIDRVGLEFWESPTDEIFQTIESKDLKDYLIGTGWHANSDPHRVGPEQMTLGTRATNVLKSLGLNTLYDLTQKDDLFNTLLNHKHCGFNAAFEIYAKAHAFYKTELPNWDHVTTRTGGRNSRSEFAQYLSKF